MISFLPELPAPPLSSPPLASQAAGSTGTLDFAGLLNAAMPSEVAIAPETAPSETALSETVLPGSPLPALPGETPLPPFAAGLRALTDRAHDPAPDAGPEAEITPASTTLPSGTILPETGETLPLTELPVSAPVSELVSEMPDTTAEQPEDETEEGIAPEPAAAVLPLVAPERVLASVPLAAPLTPPPVAPSAAPASRQPLPAAPLAVRVSAAPRAPVPPVPSAPLPLTPVSEEASASVAPMIVTFASELAEAAPSSAAPLQQQPGTPALPPTTPAPLALIERAEVRSPAPSQESTIAQVGEIREALRAVRPEMTLRHAEFGLISLRIEGAASQDPRAVLASRDPGFVPAMQAALAERVVAAAEDAVGTGTGFSSDQQRYGFSQGSGQGSSQPYLEQTGKRDEGASQHHRQQQRRGDEAAPAAASEAGATDARERGLFA